MIASQALLWIVVLVQAAAILSLLSQLSSIRSYLESGLYVRLSVGATAPAISCVDMQTSEPIGLGDLQSSGTGLLLIFLSSECAVCRTLLKDVSKVAEGDARCVTFYCSGNARGWETLVSHQTKHLRLIGPGKNDATLDFGVISYPTAVEIDRNGKIAGYFYPSSADDLRQRILARGQKTELATVA